MEPLQVKEARVEDRREVGTCAYTHTCTQNMHICSLICAHTQHTHMLIYTKPHENRDTCTHSCIHACAFTHARCHIHMCICTHRPQRLPETAKRPTKSGSYCVYVYVCIYVCVLSCVHVSECMFIHVCPKLYMSMRGNISMPIYVFISILLMFVCVCLCTYKHMTACMYVYS